VTTLLVLASAFVLGCQSASTTGTWKASRDVVGDTTTVHTLSGQIWPSGVELVEVVTIGVLEGPDELMFGNVTRLAEDQEGGIYVLDAQGPIIRHFDSTGAFLGNVGGAGQGPGEYGGLSLGMVVDSSGTLYMLDWGQGRIVRFAPEGQALAPWPLASSYQSTRPGTWLYSDGPGRILVPTRGTATGQPALMLIEDGQVIDSLAVPRLLGMPALRSEPYGVDTYWSWSPAGHYVVGVSNAYSLEAHAPSGVLRIKRDVPPLAVHPEEAASLRRQFEWMEIHPDYRPPEGDWIPSQMPPFRGIDVGRDGRIWVRRNTQPIPIAVDVVDSPDIPPSVPWAQPFLFDVFEEDGSYLGEVRFPDQVQPFVFGSGHVWGVRRGDLGEDYVVKLALGDEN
jgi:hypothetical protein